jgi:sugar lactone lactonase YvrE
MFSAMKKVSNIFILSLFFFLLVSSCSENDDPANPATLTPTLTGFSPTSGTEGTTVTLTGTNFSTTPANNAVKFNGTAAAVTAATSSSLTVSVPTGATTGKITVQVDSEIATSAQDFTVSPPVGLTLTLTSFSPVTGEPGTSITLLGTNFSTTATNNVVKFNGTVATVTAAGPTSLAVTVPAGASTGKITVQVGNEIATSATDFVFIESDEVIVETLAGNGKPGFENGTGAAARFYKPTGVALDASGNIYVADLSNRRIRKITPTGTVTTLAGSGIAGYADGTGTAAQFDGPYGVAVDASGNVYVADAYNHRIRKITPAGIVSTLAGSGASGFADGDGIAAKFYAPTGVAVDGSGNIYVADCNNHRIRKISPVGIVTTLAGGSTFGDTDGNVSVARFRRPGGITVDASGNIYVADTFNGRIRKITSAGEVSTLAGSTRGFSEGVGTLAQFHDPVGVALDASGNCYVGDEENDRIRKITPDGTVSTLAGGYLAGFTNGSGTDAQFRSPVGIALDASGNIYIADYLNHAIRKINK